MAAPVTVATLKRLSAKTLSEKILEEREQADPSFAVIDVRDVGMYTDSLIFAVFSPFMTESESVVH